MLIHPARGQVTRAWLDELLEDPADAATVGAIEAAARPWLKAAAVCEPTPILYESPVLSSRLAAAVCESTRDLMSPAIMWLPLCSGWLIGDHGCVQTSLISHQFPVSSRRLACSTHRRLRVRSDVGLDTAWMLKRNISAWPFMLFNLGTENDEVPFH